MIKEYSTCRISHTMIKVALLIFVVISLGESRYFDNPTLDGADYPDPGVILHEGVYYVATTTNNNASEKYPIHKSADLQNWEHIGYIFNASNFPSWSKYSYEFWAPEFHKIGDEFRVYFTARDSVTDTMTIGVASSKNVDGPYVAADRPLIAIPPVFVLDSTVINHNGTLMLLWVESQHLRIRNLTADGLAFADDNVVPILTPELDWEGNIEEGPWYLYRNGYHYVFFSANGYCSDMYALGVARSRNPAGPYEKYPKPLLVSNDKFKGPGHGSIVKDVDGIGYVYVHHGWIVDHVCGNNNRVMFSTSMEWGDDDWPKQMEMTD